LIRLTYLLASYIMIDIIRTLMTMTHIMNVSDFVYAIVNPAVSAATAVTVNVIGQFIAANATFRAGSIPPSIFMVPDNLASGANKISTALNTIHMKISIVPSTFNYDPEANTN